MINETLKEKIIWNDTDKTLAEDIIQNYEAWFDENYKDRVQQQNKNILIDGKVIDINLETAKIEREIFNDLGIKKRANIKLCLKALANKNLEIIKNTDSSGKPISDKYLEEFNEIQDNIEKKDTVLSSILNIIEEIPDNDWDLYKRWKDNSCMYNTDKDGNITGVNCCYSNIISWLDNFPLTKKKISYDKIKMEVSWNGKVIQDNDTHSLMQLFNKYLSRDYSNIKGFHDALYGYAIKREVNNVKEYFDSLKYEDDGIDYIERGIRDVLKCEEIDKYYDLYYEELKMMGVAFIRRLYNKEVFNKPTKFDSITTFASKATGSGKTTFNERLFQFGNNVGYCYVVAGCDFKPQEKDFVIQAHKNCCLCLDEVDMKRGIVNSIKGFISRQSDEFRLPYAIDSMKPIRGFVMTATSNNTDFLKDYTNVFERRWPIIHVAEDPVNNRNVNEAFDNGFGEKFWSQIKHIYETEPDYETWIEEGTPLGEKLKELQQGYKFYYTDDDYKMLDDVLEAEYAFYAYTDVLLTADDIVEQFQYTGDLSEWIKIKNESIKKKQAQDHYVPDPKDRPFKGGIERLEWIPVSTLNSVLKKLGLNCTPQGIVNHLDSTWKATNKKYKGKQYWSYVRQ